jgi:hypothetical protein
MKKINSYYSRNQDRLASQNDSDHKINLDHATVIENMEHLHLTYQNAIYGYQ